MHIRQGVFETNSSSTHGFVNLPSAQKRLSYFPFEVAEGSFKVDPGAISFQDEVVYTQLEQKIAALLVFGFPEDQLSRQDLTKKEFLDIVYGQVALRETLQFIEQALGVPLDIYPYQQPADKVRLNGFDHGSPYTHYLLHGDVAELLKTWTKSQKHRFFFYEDQGVAVFRDEEGVSPYFQIEGGHPVDLSAPMHTVKSTPPGSAQVTIDLRYDEYAPEPWTVYLSKEKSVSLAAFEEATGLRLEAVSQLVIYHCEVQYGKVGAKLMHKPARAEAVETLLTAYPSLQTKLGGLNITVMNLFKLPEIKHFKVQYISLLTYDKEYITGSPAIPANVRSALLSSKQVHASELFKLADPL